eukprot:Filipodium_phascolosomae@DN1276_c0_g1_i1.p2
MLRKQFWIVAAASRDRKIGRDGKLPWRLPADMQNFKELTSTVYEPTKEGDMNAVIMGRKTWDSIPAGVKPLKERLNIVVSRSMKADGFPSVRVVRSFEEALNLCVADPVVHQIFCIGP